MTDRQTGGDSKTEKIENITEHRAKRILDPDEHMINYLDNEEATLISILMAIAVIDGTVHRKEKKIIKKQYKEITLVAPDEKTLDTCLAKAEGKIEDILGRIKTSAEDISPEKKRSIFVHAISVAIADRTLHKKEIDLLLQVSEALDLTKSTIGTIGTKEELVRLIKQSHRVKS